MGGGGGQQQVQTTESQNTLSPEQRELMGLMMPGIKDHLANPMELFGPSKIQDFDPLQQQSMDMLQGAAADGGQMDRVNQQKEGGFNTLVGGGPAAQLEQSTVDAINAQQGGVGASGAKVMDTATPNVQRTDGGPANISGIQNVGVDPNALSQAFMPSANTNLTNAALQGPGNITQGNAELNDALSFLLGPVLDTSNNSALDGATQAAIKPLTEQFNETILPGIRNGAVTAGAMGGSRQGIAEGIASRELLQGVGDVTANVQSEAYKAGLDQMGQTARGSESVTLGTLDTLLKDQTNRLGISADTLTSSLGSKLGAENSRFATEQGAEAQMQAAQLQADSAAAQHEASLRNSMEQARLSADTSIQMQELQGQQAAIQGMLQSQAANRGISVDAMIAGMSQAEQTALMSTLQAATIGGVGDAQQAQDQAKLTEEADKFMAEQMLPFAQLQDVAALTFGMPGGGTMSTSTGPAPQGPGTLSKVAGAAGTVASLAGMFSDRRMKTDITEIGELKNGLKLYSFKYLWETITRTGFMADEVAKVIPEAVWAVGAFLRVDTQRVFRTEFEGVS